MKTLLRYYLINLTALVATMKVVPGLTYSGGLKTLFLGALVFSIINFLLVPLLKILLLPLNLLTLGLFAWLTNVLAIYALTTVISDFRLTPFFFSGFEYGGFNIPAMELTSFWVAVLSSFVIGAVTHALQWLSH